ncbi:hypothetical protein EIM50_24575, partial [Pseudoxanthomonas sp. SGD-10]
MKNYIHFSFRYILISAVGLFYACGQSNKESTSDQADSIATSPLTVEAIQESNDFPNASLTIANVNTEAVGDSVKVTFDFSVSNYELTKQTEDMHAEHAANSAEGQHIHFILDN